MKTNPLIEVKHLGQSLWLDYIQRGLLSSGEFQQLIDNDGICGVTSNPSIFEKAMVEHNDYDAAIKHLQGSDANIVYEQLAIEDLQQAADLLNPVYESSQGRDGYVSFEVAPQLAYDTEATVEEARRLWAALNRPNSLIKVPATLAGVAAIQQLTAAGINVNATLLFSLQRYLEVAQAYISGLEMRAAKGESLTSAASVASFFLSRIDTLVDSQLDAQATANPQPALQEKAQQLRGQTAIASARLAYQDYKRLFSGARWQRLAAVGASTQRLLWASTSTKDPSYSDIKYVEALIGSDTINTLPMETVAAYRDHGQPALRLEDDIDKAQQVVDDLSEVQLDLIAVTDQLEKEGVQKFSAAYNKLFDNLKQRID